MKERSDPVNQNLSYQQEFMLPPTIRQKSVLPYVLIGIGYMIFYVVWMLIVQVAAILVYQVKAEAQLGIQADEEAIMKLAKQLLLDNAELINLIVQFSAILLIVLLYVIIRVVSNQGEKPSVRDYFSLKRIKLSTAGISILIAISMYFVVVGFMAVATELFPALGESYNDAMGTDEKTNWLFLFLTTVIGAPLVEELIYRNMAITNMRRAMPPIAAALISAVVFGAVHGHPLQIVYAASLGVIFGILFVRTDSIYPSLIAHTVFNAMGIMFSYIGQFIDTSNEESPEAIVFDTVIFLLMLASLVGAPLLIWLFLRMTNREKKLINADSVLYQTPCGNPTQPTLPLYGQMPNGYPYQPDPTEMQGGWVFDPRFGWIWVKSEPTQPQVPTDPSDTSVQKVKSSDDTTDESTQ